MGNPRRFLGAAEPITIDGITIPAQCAVEVTFRAHQQRFLLRPDEEVNEILLGCFGRAYDRYPGMDVGVLSILSNHGGFLALPESAHVLSNFMRDFLSTAAKRLNLHHDRDGTFWERRYRAIPIIDEQALEDRFRYVLTQGTKENLVWSARDWPGVSSAKALLGGPPLVGRWRDHAAEGELRRRQERKVARARASGRDVVLPKLRPIWREYPIELVPLPHWRSLTVGQRRSRVADILREDDEFTRERHSRAGTQPLGVRGIRATDPRSRPAEPAKSPAPNCHASTKAGRTAFRKAYRAFLDAVRSYRERIEAALERAAIPSEAMLREVVFRFERTTPAGFQSPSSSAQGPPGA